MYPLWYELSPKLIPSLKSKTMTAGWHAYYSSAVGEAICRVIWGNMFGRPKSSQEQKMHDGKVRVHFAVSQKLWRPTYLWPALFTVHSEHNRTSARGSWSWLSGVPQTSSKLTATMLRWGFRFRPPCLRCLPCRLLLRWASKSAQNSSIIIICVQQHE